MGKCDSSFQSPSSALVEIDSAGLIPNAAVRRSRRESRYCEKERNIDWVDSAFFNVKDLAPDLPVSIILSLIPCIQGSL